MMCPEQFGRVAVLMGGEGSEREVSLNSGCAILHALQQRGVAAEGIDLATYSLAPLDHRAIDAVFIAVHGTWGEDGRLQRLLDERGIPYPGSNAKASALTFDKWRCNEFLKLAGIPVLPTLKVNQNHDYAAMVGKLGLPLCVKPNADGSSVGVTQVQRVEQLSEAIKGAQQNGGEALIEPWIMGTEYTVAILGDTVLPIIEIQAPEIFYDYQAKYAGVGTQYLCPAPLPDQEAKKLQQLAWRSFELTGCKDWARVDFIRDQHGKFWFLELNTIPGMTDTSLVPKAAAVLGIDFVELVWRIMCGCR